MPQWQKGMSEKVMKQIRISRTGLKEVEILGTRSSPLGVKVPPASENWDGLPMLLTKSRSAIPLKVSRTQQPERGQHNCEEQH